MIARISHLALSATLAVCLSSCAAKHTDYGEPLRLKSKDTVALKTVLAQPEQYDGKTMRV